MILKKEREIKSTAEISKPGETLEQPSPELFLATLNSLRSKEALDLLID